MQKALIAFVLPGQGPNKTAATLSQALANAGSDVLMELVKTRFTALQSARPTTPLQVGMQYVDIGRLVPGQTRIAIDRAAEKVVKQAELGGFSTSTSGVHPSFGNGKATVPLNTSTAKPGVIGPGGIVLVKDGNHQAVASILAGASQVPMQLGADFSHLSKDEFWQMAKDNGWTYLADLGGAPGAIDNASYAKLQNDPLRFLMTKVALKAAKGAKGLVFEQTDRMDTRSWVKLKGRSVDFVEFKLADVAYRAADADPALKARLLSDDLSVSADAVRETLQGAVKSGHLDPAALGIVLLDAGASLTDATFAIAMA